jgi:glycosyltransferase A (GT-A) superfamily protein (DUF2064 family)
LGYSLARWISLWLFVACLSIAGTARAAEKADSVADRLAKVEVFAFGGVGFAGVISPGEMDYRLLLSQPSAEAHFERLFAVGNPQAKGYALVGLRHLNSERFKALAASLRSSKIAVSTMHGCLMRHETMAAILADIQAGNYSK